MKVSPDSRKGSIGEKTRRQRRENVCMCVNLKVCGKTPGNEEGREM